VVRAGKQRSWPRRIGGTASRDARYDLTMATGVGEWCEWRVCVCVCVCVCVRSKSKGRESFLLSRAELTYLVFFALQDLMSRSSSLRHPPLPCVLRGSHSPSLSGVPVTSYLLYSYPTRVRVWSVPIRPVSRDRVLLTTF
jgi:hypothetical protein